MDFKHTDTAVGSNHRFAASPRMTRAVGASPHRSSSADSAAALGSGGAADAEQMPSQKMRALKEATDRTLTILDDQVEQLTQQLTSRNLADAAMAASALTAVGVTVDAVLARYGQVLTERPEVSKELGYRHSTDLLMSEFGIRHRRAQDALVIGAALTDRRYPQLAAAIEDGVVSVDQAGVAIRTLDEFAARHETAFMLQADAGVTTLAVGDEESLPVTPEQLRKIVRAWFRKHEPVQAELDEQVQWELRRCSYATRDDGMIHLEALLPHSMGVAVIELLDAHASPKVRFTDTSHGRASADEPDEPDDRASGGSSTGDAVIDSRTRKQKMADGFARAFQLAAISDGAPTQAGRAPVLTITISEAELDKHAAGLPALAQTARTEEFIPAHVAARVACDGVIQAAVTGKDGEVLHLGRSQRLFTAKQKTALGITYKSCAVGDCDIPARWCEAHHVIPWSEGGSTDLPDGVLVCNFHHHQIHQGALTVERPPGIRRFRVSRRTRRRPGRTERQRRQEPRGGHGAVPLGSRSP